MAPLGVAAVAAFVLSMLAYSRRPTKSFRVNVQFIVSLATWALLWFATASSFAKDGMTSLPLHMIGHILVMFVVPMGVVGSSFVRSLWWLFGAPRRRRLLSWWYRQRAWHAPRWLFHPLVAALVMNVVMVAAHLSPVFDFMMTRAWAMDWLMEPAFLLSGLFFFHFIIPSLPRKMHVRARMQLAMIIATMAVMLILAMAMSIFTKGSWYSVMVMHPGMAAMPNMTASVSVAFGQQRLAAAILWICGDVWAIPCLVLIVRRVIARDGSLFSALERQTSRLTGVAG